MKTCSKNIHVIDNNGTEDGSNATCNHALLGFLLNQVTSFGRVDWATLGTIPSIFVLARSTLVEEKYMVRLSEQNNSMYIFPMIYASVLNNIIVKYLTEICIYDKGIIYMIKIKVVLDTTDHVLTILFTIPHVLRN